VKISASLPTGVAALFFESAARRRAVENRLAEALLAAGFSEALLPILDYVEPYEPLLTAESRAELYRFADRDGELLALRADFTPLLARLLAPRLDALPLPLRLFYRGDVVRYQEERAGREREFYQMGAELLGAPGEEAEREMLVLFLSLLDAVTDPTAPVQVVMGFAGALDRLLAAAGGADPARLAAAVSRRERGVARAASRALFEVVEDGVPTDPAELGEEAALRLGRLRLLGDELGQRFPRLHLTLDLAEFAGQNPYYDGLVFRAHSGAAGVPIGGGGRYDRLFRRLGAEVSAVGFSLSVDRLAVGP
jgi:ATP phosphoribosyltransferase regulatory subunit